MFDFCIQLLVYLVVSLEVQYISNTILKFHIYHRRPEELKIFPRESSTVLWSTLDLFFKLYFLFHCHYCLVYTSLHYFYFVQSVVKALSLSLTHHAFHIFWISSCILDNVYWIIINIWEQSSLGYLPHCHKNIDCIISKIPKRKIVHATPSFSWGLWSELGKWWWCVLFQFDCIFACFFINKWP